MTLPHLPAKVRGLIFDMDGTMVDSMPFHARSWAEFCRRHGVALPIGDVLRRTTGRTGVECIRELLGADVTQELALELIAEKEACYRALFASEFREVAGFARFAAAAARRGLRLAVATAGDRHNIAFTLDHLRLPVALDAVVGGDEGLRGKPEPDLFLEAARRLGLPPQDCVVFEDAPFGIEAARRGGFAAIGLCTTHTATELAGPHVIAQVADFEALLQAGVFAPER